MGAGALGPDLQLFAGGGAEGVGGDDHHLRPLARQVGGDLAQGRRLARAVDPDEQDDEGLYPARHAVRPQRVEGRLTVDQFGGHGLGQGLLDLPLVGALAEAQVAEALDDPVGRSRAEIALQQMFFQSLQRLLAEGLLDEGGDHLVGHLFRRPGQAVAQPLEPAFFGRIAHGIRL